MATLALIGVGVLALLVAILFAALVEMYRDIRQLRDALGILDRPIAIDARSVAGTRPSTYGLPIDLDSCPSALVLFLSDRCGTCGQIANGLGPEMPDRLWVVLEARNAESAELFLDRYRLTGAARVIVDAADAIARSIGLDTTPVGFHVKNGVFTAATTVPSTRYLNSILPDTMALGRASARLEYRSVS